MSGNKAMDKILDEIIDEAASIAAENMGRNIPEPDSVEFSREHEAAMRKIFRKERKKSFFKKVSKYSKRAAVVFLAVIIMSGIAVYSVEAWRIRVLNFVIEMRQTHSEISFEENDIKGDSYSSDEITLTYIPDGFTLEKRDIKENMLSLVFKGEEYYFIFSMSDTTSTIGIDTENASVKKIKINGQDAFYSSNSNISFLVWHDESCSYTLSGTLGEREMVKVAESIKK